MIIAVVDHIFSFIPSVQFVVKISLLNKQWNKYGAAMLKTLKEKKWMVPFVEKTMQTHDWKYISWEKPFGMKKELILLILYF